MTHKFHFNLILFFIIILTIFNCSNSEWNREFKKFETIYSFSEQFCPQKQNLQLLTFGSIRNYLKSLDPHSFFLDPLSLRALQEDQEGEFFGIGIRVTKYRDKLTIIAAMPETPAFNVGISPGDIIVEIDKKITTNLSLTQAKELIRGYRDSSVNIKVFRPSTSKHLIFNIKRTQIPLNTISYYLIHPLHQQIGYVNIETFGRTTPNELLKILERFSKKKIKGLIIDLRNNTGGSLYAAITISELFLTKGKTILSIRGRRTNYTIETKLNNQYEHLQIVTLINGNSASASEILAAALKENNRTVVVGEKSFGKGLVETIYQLPSASAMALTTAKYYTPSGRCLQKSFKLYQNFLPPDIKNNNLLQGGVNPDYPVKSLVYSTFVSNLISNGIFFNFSRSLIDNKDFQILTSFKITKKIITQFKIFLRKIKFKFSQIDFDKNLEEIKYEIKRDLFSNRFTPKEGAKVFLTRDPASIKATKILNSQISK